MYRLLLRPCGLNSSSKKQLLFGNFSKIYKNTGDIVIAGVVFK